MSRSFSPMRRCLPMGIVFAMLLLAACSSQPLIKTPATLYIAINPDHGAHGILALRLQDGTQRWFAPSQGYVSAPVLANGTLYTDAFALHAANGKLLFTYSSPAYSSFSLHPVILSDKIYLPGQTDLSVFNRSTGGLLSYYPMNIRGFDSTNYNLATEDGVVFLRTYGPPNPMYVDQNVQYIAAIRLVDGKRLWQMPVDDADSVPFITVANGIVYTKIIKDHNRAVPEIKLDALDAHTGRLLWQRPEGYSTDFGAPPIVGNRLYISGQSGVEALDALTSKLLWFWRHTQFGEEAPLITANNHLYVLQYCGCAIPGEAADLPSKGSHLTTLWALRLSDGSVAWQKQFPVSASRLVYQDGILAFIGNSTSVYAVQATDGALLWHKSLNGPVGAARDLSVGE